MKTPYFSFKQKNLGDIPWEWICNIFGLISGISLGSYISWGTVFFWRYPRGVFPIVILSSLAYEIVSIVVIKVVKFPKVRDIGVVFLSVSIGYLAVFSIVAMFRFYYSRSFLLCMYIFSLVFVFLFLRLSKRFNVLNFAVVPSGISTELKKQKSVNMFEVDSPEASIDADGIVVDLHRKLSPEWIRFIADCNLKGIPIYHSAAIYEIFSGKVSLAHLSEGTLDVYKLPFLYKGIKRIIDVLVVILSAPITIPMGVLIAILVKIDSPGPVFFIQQRTGQGGKVFDMVKFRTMIVDSKSEDKACFAQKDDERITKVGRILRKLRLDELPQFWNVLKGEMSLIGPRPEQVPFVREFTREIPFYSYRHLVKPGITGWAQVNLGYTAGTEETREKLEYDLYYIKNLSLWLDLLIVVKTLGTMVFGSGAR